MKSTSIETAESMPYDSAFCTLINDCAALALPLINELFGVRYTGAEPVHRLHDGHLIHRKDGSSSRVITDTALKVCSEVPEPFHLECQSTSDATMPARMFEYDSQIALDAGEARGPDLTVTFPRSAVLFLRHTSRTPDRFTVTLRTACGELTHPVPILKVQAYTVQDIFDRKLLFLIPFHLFTYEKRFKVYEENEDLRRELGARYLDIAQRLDDLRREGEITEFTKRTLYNMTAYVARNLARKFPNVKKEVTDIMSGRILDYEAKDILNQGRLEGHREGRLVGMNLLSSLINKLIELGRSDEIPKVTTDGSYRDQLFAELAIK